MKTLAILNGPNLNLLGKREPELYGKETLPDILTAIQTHVKEHSQGDAIELLHFQSNHEGKLIDFIHTLHDNPTNFIGLIVNLGAYTHSSPALYDALRALDIPIIEVHLSNTSKREEFRHHSYITPLAKGIIMGLGKWGYLAAAEYLIKQTQ